MRISICLRVHVIDRLGAPISTVRSCAELSKLHCEPLSTHCAYLKAVKSSSGGIPSAILFLAFSVLNYSTTVTGNYVCRQAAILIVAQYR